MSKKFPDLVTEQVREDRPTILVDNLHGCARIEQRMRCLWSAITLPDEQQNEAVLSCLVGIASMAQHHAESMGMTTEQGAPEQEVSSANLKIARLTSLLNSILEQMGCSSKSIAPLQLGTKRYSFEFNEDWYHDQRTQLETITQ